MRTLIALLLTITSMNAWAIGNNTFTQRSKKDYSSLIHKPQTPPQKIYYVIPTPAETSVVVPQPAIVAKPKVTLPWATVPKAATDVNSSEPPEGHPGTTLNIDDGEQGGGGELVSETFTPDPILSPAPVVVPEVKPPVKVVPTPAPLSQRPVEKIVETPPAKVAPVPVTMSNKLRAQREQWKKDHAAVTSNKPATVNATTETTNNFTNNDEGSTETVGGGTPSSQTTTPTIKDLPNCKYYSDCWARVSFQDKVKKIVANTNYVNGLHGTKIDPRYMLCTAWRESTFNPGAANSIGARGMGQITTKTGLDAIKMGPKVPGFTGLSYDKYRTAMEKSSVAQTEMSMLVVLLKIKEGGVSSRIKNGGATPADYKALAWRYVGQVNTTYAHDYRDDMNDCYSCLAKNVSLANAASGTPTQTIKNCLAKAKARD